MWNNIATANQFNGGTNTDLIIEYKIIDRENISVKIFFLIIGDGTEYKKLLNFYMKFIRMSIHCNPLNTPHMLDMNIYIMTCTTSHN